MNSQDSGEDLGALTAQAVRLLRMSHLTLEQAFDALFWIDREGRIRRTNAAAQQVLGRSRDELALLPIDEVVSPSVSFRPRGGRLGATWHFEARLRTPHDAELPVDVAVCEIDHEGERYACAFVRDISPLKRSEQMLRNALEEVEQLKNRLHAENVYLQDEIKQEHDFEEIVGQSEALAAVLRSIGQVAATDATVLILGESGTGKELVARAIHDSGGRKDRPLVKVNCAALPANLIESELFGHEKGAFTGALQRRVGRFELAHGGTIFLDEIGDLPLELQAKLLRVLQEGELERLGAPRTIEVDVRVIAATNHDLAAAVEQGRFRADLFYRLNVFPVLLPPLRDRGDDVVLLARHFAAKYGRKLGRPIERIGDAMLAQLLDYDWPGNVRELQNVIERAVIVNSGGILSLDQPLSGTRSSAAAPRPVASQGDPRSPAEHAWTPANGNARAGSGAAEGAAPRTLREVEEAMIREALTACHGVIGGKRGAAARLDMAPSTLRERMQRYGIRRPGGRD